MWWCCRRAIHVSLQLTATLSMAASCTSHRHAAGLTNFHDRPPLPRSPRPRRRGRGDRGKRRDGPGGGGGSESLRSPRRRTFATTTRRRAREMAEALSRSCASAVLERRIDVEILPGAEIAFDRLHLLDDGRPAAVRSRRQPELPADRAAVLRLAARHRRPAAPPARSWASPPCSPTPSATRPSRNHPQRLAELVSAGALVQLTAASITGDFGAAAARSSRTLLSAGLAHLVATDTHRAEGRGTSLAPALESLRDPALARWLTQDVPAAIVEGAPLPAAPGHSRSGWLRKTSPARRSGISTLRFDAKSPAI